MGPQQLGMAGHDMVTEGHMLSRLKGLPTKLGQAATGQRLGLGKFPTKAATAEKGQQAHQGERSMKMPCHSS